MSRLDNRASLRDLVRAFDALVENFIASYQDRPPAGLVLDLDPTACIVYGQQELGLFNTHVGDTCLMPFHLYEGQSGRLIATAMHPGKTPAARAIIGILRRVVRRLRAKWPRLPLIFRADGHHSKPEVLAWLERQDIRYVIGYAPNAVLEKQFGSCVKEARQRYARHAAEGRPEVAARTFASGTYSAGSWKGQQRRIVCRAQSGPHGIDARFVVTDLQVIGAQKLYVTTVAPGSPANVTQNFDGSIVHLFFDIPQGVPGEVAQTDLEAAINTTALNPVSVPALPPGATLAEVVAAFNELRGALIRV